MRRILILSNIKNIDKSMINNSFIIGVDKGAYLAATNNIKMDIAIGDFDSINPEMMDTIELFSNKIIKLNSIKDKTDTDEALDLCNKDDEIIILGGIQGNRIEHFIANLIQLKNHPNLKIIDDNSLIETKTESFKPNNNYKFISFFSLTNSSIISLTGFSYPLDSYVLKNNDPLCISNEINSKDPYVTIKEGRLLVIYTKDDNK